MLQTFILSLTGGSHKIRITLGDALIGTLGVSILIVRGRAEVHVSNLPRVVSSAEVLASWPR
jgi:hypothetical protein